MKRILWKLHRGEKGHEAIMAVVMLAVGMVVILLFYKMWEMINTPAGERVSEVARILNGEDLNPAAPSGGTVVRLPVPATGVWQPVNNNPAKPASPVLTPGPTPTEPASGPSPTAPGSGQNGPDDPVVQVPPVAVPVPAMEEPGDQVIGIPEDPIIKPAPPSVPGSPIDKPGTPPENGSFELAREILDEYQKIKSEKILQDSIESAWDQSVEGLNKHLLEKFGRLGPQGDDLVVERAKAVAFMKNAQFATTSLKVVSSALAGGQSAFEFEKGYLEAQELYSKGDNRAAFKKTLTAPADFITSVIMESKYVAGVMETLDPGSQAVLAVAITEVVENVSGKVAVRFFVDYHATGNKYAWWLHDTGYFPKPRFARDRDFSKE